MKQPVERVIYDNYDLWSRYEEAARENIAINTGRSEPDENAIWKEIYDLDELEWDDAKAILDSFLLREHGLFREGLKLGEDAERVARSFTISILFLTKQPRIVITSKSGMRMDIYI